MARCPRLPCVVGVAAGADSIIALRCAEASSQWEATYRTQHNPTPAA
jgi:hypothetical protein